MLRPLATTRKVKDGCAATVCRHDLRERGDDGKCANHKCLMLVLVFDLNALLVGLLLRVQFVVVLVG